MDKVHRLMHKNINWHIIYNSVSQQDFSGTLDSTIFPYVKIFYELLTLAHQMPEGAPINADNQKETFSNVSS